MKKRELPPRLQPFLWSQGTSSLSLNHDRVYITHQILRYGDMPAIKWLLKKFSRKDLAQTFLDYPMKIYSKSSLNFAKNFILNLEKKKINEDQYLLSSPRRIASRRS